MQCLKACGDVWPGRDPPAPAQRFPQPQEPSSPKQPEAGCRDLLVRVTLV